MRLLALFLCLLSSNSVWSSVAPADTINDLMSKSSDIIKDKVVQDIAFGLYLQGPTLSFNGQEVIQSTSTNPQGDFVAYHIKNFCSKNVDAEKDGLECQTDFGKNATYMEFGDIKTSSLLGPSSYTNQYMDISAQQFIRNVVQPFPDNGWSLELANKSNRITNGDNNRRKAYAQSLAQQALYNVARYSLNNSYMNRLSTSSLQKYSGDEDTSAQSILSVMEEEATKWYNKVDFNQTGPGQTYSNPLAFAQVMAQMMSFQLWMNFQQYKQLERIETLLAAQLSNAVSNSAATAAAMGRK